MKVKWHGKLSSERKLKGGGPQGSSFGLWEYLSQSNDNADCVEEQNRFKFVDDLSFLEIIYLLNIGISSYNVKAHVPSDIPTHNQIIPNSKIPKLLGKDKSMDNQPENEIERKEDKSYDF